MEEQTVQRPPQVTNRAGLFIGLVSGLIMTLVMVALRFAYETPVLPEIIADWLTSVTPPEVFDFVLEHLQVAAKPLMFSTLLVTQVFAGGILGVAHVRYSSKTSFLPESTWVRSLILATVIWLIFMVLASPIIGAGLFGASLADGPLGYMSITYVSFLAFSATLVELHRIAMARLSPEPVSGRREFMRRAAFFGLFAAVGGLAVRTIFQNTSAVTPSTVASVQGMPPEITPNDDFYEVSKNIVNPSVDVIDWKLEFAGDFGNPCR